MKYFFCLIPKKDAENGLNIGRRYAYEHKSSWIQDDIMATYLSAGYVQGVDYVTHNGKAYKIMKTLLDIDQHCGIFICVESVSGCDI